MFCPNCGNNVQDGSNFCPNCGKNLKNVKITITKKQLSNKNNSAFEKPENKNQETQIFKPLKNLDGIDSTNEISDIIKAVDEKISENIHKYETNSYNKVNLNDLNIDEQSKTNKMSSENKKSYSENSINNTHSIKSEDDKIQNKYKNEKFSLKKMWQDFINENDDEFSIFSSIDEQEETNNDKIELVNSSITSDTQTNISTDTTGIPKAAIDEKLKELELSKNINNKKENDKDLKANESSTNTNTAKDSDQKLKKSKIKKNNKHPDTKLKEPEEKLSHKSFTDQVNEELKKLEIQNEIQNENQNNIKTDNIQNKDDKSKKTPFNSAEKYSQVKSSEKSLESAPREKFAEFMNFIVEKLDKINSLVIDKGKNGIIIFSIIGILLSLIPIIIGSRRISIFIIVLLVFKILFSIAEFYIPLNIATDKVWVESSDDEVKYFSFINWFICQIFLFIAFIFSPWNGFFTFKLLPALTPLPIATILLFIIAMLISLGQYWSQLKDQNKMNFIAWYLIPFILIHFLSKLIFVILNFIG